MDIKSIEKKLVIKNNKLIEFKGRLSKNELQLFSLIMANVHEDESSLTEENLLDYKIDIAELRETTKHKDFHTYLKETAFGLEEKSIVIDFVEGGKKKSAKIRLIYRPVVSGEDNSLQFYLDREMIPFILQFKKMGYTSYEFANILKMRSAYSIRIYELIKQYQGKRGFKRYFEIDELKGLLGIKEEYPEFKSFNNRVLKQAKEEINENTDIDIEYVFKKKGRAVVGVEILAKHTLSDEEEKLLELYDIADLKKRMGLDIEIFKDHLTDKKILNLYTIACEMTPSEYDVFKYALINRIWLTEQESVRNPYGLYKKALEEDLGKAVALMKMEDMLSKSELN